MLRKHKQREGVSADPPARQPFLECLSCCYEKAHLLLGNPGYGIIKEPPPLLGTHAASLASDKLLLKGSVHVLELLDTVELDQKR